MDPVTRTKSIIGITVGMLTIIGIMFSIFAYANGIENTSKKNKECIDVIVEDTIPEVKALSVKAITTVTDIKLDFNTMQGQVNVIKNDVKTMKDDISEQKNASQRIQDQNVKILMALSEIQAKLNQ